MEEDKDIDNVEDEETKIEDKEINTKKNSEETLTDKLRNNYWILSTIILGILLLGFLFSGSMTGNTITGKVISDADAGQMLLNYYTEKGATGLELISVEEESGLYKINFNYENQTIPIYLTKDGKLAGSLNPISFENETKTTEATSTKSTEVPKSDKPVVELFVMSYCPYGTQAEKGIIPTIKALGDFVDAKIRFVHYFMHGEPEEQETAREICIREEQEDKFMSYLECFLSGNGVVDEKYGLVMEGKNPTTCMNEVGINVNAINECVSSEKWKEYYAEDSQLSNQYGVQGSPTLVINGVQANSGRDSASYLKTICSAFNTAPEICKTAKLSSTTPSPYFGWDSSGSNTNAQC